MKSTARLVSDTHQKNFVKLLESCCGKYGRWENWSDFITLTATSISNTVDKAHSDEREKMYLSIEAKHSKEEMDAFAGMYAETVLGLEENPNQDFLGELFMRLELGSDHNGQFFTPYHVCEFMSAVTTGDLKQAVDEQGWIGVNDPCCGAGALLVAFANRCKQEKINYQASVLFAAQDIDYIVGMMCYIQLSLLGCAGYVSIGDSLAHPTIGVVRRGLIPADNGNVWYTPMFVCRPDWFYRRLAAQMALICQVPAEATDATNQRATNAKEVTEASKNNSEKELEIASFNSTATGQLTFF